MSLTKEEVLNGLYNAGLITVGAAGYRWQAVNC